MGCGGSKVDSLPLVKLCRERKQYIKTAREHQHTMALAHILYFKSLKEVGEILNRFVDEELMVASSSSSSSSSLSSSPSPVNSPILRIPSEDRKKKKNTKTPSSTSISHSPSNSHLHSSSDSEHNSSSHIHFIESTLVEEPPSPSHPHGNAWGYAPPSSHVYYMKKYSSTIPSMYYEEPESSTTKWGGFGRAHYSGNSTTESKDRQWQTPEADPPPPPSPKVSVWDFMNPFGAEHDGYEYNSESGRRYGWGSSSLDSQEVREREGIPDLEEEGEQEVLKQVQRENIVGGHEDIKEVNFQNKRSTEEHDFESLKKVEAEVEEGDGRRNRKDVASVIDEDGEVVGEGRCAGVDETSVMEVDVSQTGGTSSLAVHGSKNFIEAVRAVRTEFEAASNYGKEVTDLLDVGTVPYRPRSTAVNVVFSRILYFFASSSHSSSDDPTKHLASNIMKERISNPQNSFVPEFNLSSTLEKLYFWETKLFKQIKEEEMIRVRYERRRKKFRGLCERGADSSKIDTQQASMRSLLTKLQVSVRSINGIALRIHRLRDEELHPLLHNLIKRLTAMWKAMLRCHVTQLNIIVAAESRTLRAKTVRSDVGPHESNTLKLEAEVLRWRALFGDWVRAQKSYSESLNGWLERWLLREPEETVDGVAPFSPGRSGAPPVFVAAGDWARAMESVRPDGVDSAMRDLARGLRRLAENQEDERSQRATAEYLKTRVGYLREGTGDFEKEMYSKLAELREEKIRHRKAVRAVKGAASETVHDGLAHVLESLSSFTACTVEAHERVRVRK